jgi:hypothetical protein
VKKKAGPFVYVNLWKDSSVCDPRRLWIWLLQYPIKLHIHRRHLLAHRHRQVVHDVIGDTSISSPLSDTLKITALAVEIEILCWMLLYLSPHQWNEIGVGITNQRL